MLNIINSIFFYPLKKNLLTGIDGHIGKNNVYICGYPISGNSWIAYLVSYVLNCRYFDIDSKEWSKQRKGLRKYLVGENKHIKSKKFDWVLKTHAIPGNLTISKNDKVVYIIRNIRDVVNSQFHRFEKTLPHSNKKLISLTAKSLKFLIPFRVRYKYLTRAFAREWAEHINNTIKSDIFIVSYEDIYENPLIELKKLIYYLDPLSYDEKTIKEALEVFSFSNMKESAKQTIDGSLLTDRIGGYGDWKNYFTSDDNQWFEDNYDEILKKIKPIKEKV